MSSITISPAEVPVHNLQELSFEDTVTLHRAVDFTLNCHPESRTIDPLHHLPNIRELLADMVFPLCDDECIPVAYTQACERWANCCTETGHIVMDALMYFAAQDPEEMRAKDEGAYEYLVPHLSSARYLLAYPHFAQEELF